MNTTVFGTTCVGIARVSTSVQDTKYQEETLENKAKELGLTMEKIFETKESGFVSLDKKEGFGMLQEYLLTHSCRIVIVTEMSRLARRKIILEQIKQWFLDNRIQLYVINLSFTLFDDFGNASPTSDIVFSVFASMAESEMKVKKVRFAQSHRDLNQQGLSIVGKVLFGYDRVPRAVYLNGRYRSKMVVNAKAAGEIKQIYEWYLNGINGDSTQCSVTKIKDECIARGFSEYLHSKRNVNKALKCAFYTGEIIETQYKRKSTEYWNYKDESAPKYVMSEPGAVKYPQIISKELFQEVQEKMRLANTKLTSDGKGGYSDQSRAHFTLLAKLVKCTCGLSMTGDYRKGRGRTGHGLIVKTYRCTKHSSHGSISLPMRILDCAVWSVCMKNREKYIEYLNSFPFQSSVDELNIKIENLEKEKKKVEENQRITTNRYLKVRKYNVSDKVYFDEIKALEKESLRLEQLIRKEQDSLNQLKATKTDFKEFVEHIHSIEGDKYRMRIFIQRMVESVHPFFRDHCYTVTEVIMRDMSFAVRTTDPDAVSNGLPDKVYIITDTSNTMKPRIRFISGPCVFASDEKLFYLPNSDQASLEQVFEDDDEVYFKDIPLKPLDFDDTIDPEKEDDQ